MVNCRNTQQLNITCGTDVVLHDKLMFDDEVFDPNFSVDIECNLVNSLGKRTSLEYEIADERLIIQIPWVDGRNAGCYGLEVKGKCNGKTWATYADSLIRYTRATVEGAAVVETEHDWYDVTQVVSYRYSDSPLDEVDATIDDNYGEPTVTPTYEHNKLTLDFKNLRGNGIMSVEQTVTSTEDEGINETTITQDNGNATVMQVRNGSKGAKGDKGDPGDSAIFDPTTGNISEMKQTTGNSIVSPMSQNAVTEEFYKSARANEELIDLTNIAEASGYIESNKWGGSTSSSYKHKMLNVSKVRGKTLRMRWQSGESFECALTVNTFSQGADVQYATGTSGMWVNSSNSDQSIVIPNDANYLFVSTKRSGTALSPVLSLVDTVKESLAVVEDAIDNAYKKTVANSKEITFNGTDNGYVNNAGKWVASSSGNEQYSYLWGYNLRGKVLRIEANKDYFYTNGHCPSVSLLADTDTTAGNYAVFCNGYTGNIYAASLVTCVKIPDDCTRIVIRTKQNNVSYLPEKVEIIDTLEATAEDKNRRISTLEDASLMWKEIPLISYTEQGGYITHTLGVNTWTSATNYKFRLIPMSGIKKVRITPVSKVRYTFLNTPYSSGATITMATGYSGFGSITTNIQLTVDVPSDAVYLYIQTQAGAGSLTPCTVEQCVYVKDAIGQNSNVVKSDGLAFTNGTVYSDGSIAASDTSILSSPIMGGKGFLMQFNDGYQLQKVHLFDMNDNLVYYRYYPDCIGTWMYGVNEWGDNKIPRQYYVRVEIGKSNSGNISPNDYALKKFTYLDSKELAPVLPEGGYFENAQKRIRLQCEVIWKPLAKVRPGYEPPADDKVYNKGLVYIGLPYSDPASYSKYIGWHVSYRTFLSAVHNKRSLLYTESAVASENISGYGMTYRWSDYHYNRPYYGTVCSGFTGYVAGFQKLFISGCYGNGSIPGLTQVSNPTCDNVQPLDFLHISGHIAIISNIYKDKYGKVKYVEVAEQSRPTQFISPYSRDGFAKRLESYTVWRWDGWSNLQLPSDMPSYIQTEWDDMPGEPEYNDDICTFAGDYASFATGDKIFLNLHRNGDVYTHLELYKDDVLTETIDISNATTYPSDTFYPDDEDDWVKFDLTSYNLTGGKYKARLKNGDNYSGYTYFEVLQISFTAEKNGNAVDVTFSSSNGTPYLIERVNTGGFSSATNNYYHELTAEEVTAGQLTINWNFNSDTNYKWIKVFVRGDYGVNIKEVKLID